jgi:hypothetical protein
MIEVEISTQLLGVLASLVAAGFSLIPALGANSTRRALVAIVVLVAGVFIEQGMELSSWSEFGTTFLAATIYAVTTYSIFLKPIVMPAAASVAARIKG